MKVHILLSLTSLGNVLGAVALPPRSATGTDGCPGYVAQNVLTSPTGLKADLKLAGAVCNVYSTDLADLRLEVEFQSPSRLHVKIYDAAEQVYQIPESVVNIPNGTVESNDADLEFKYTKTPFSFAVIRKASGEIIFDTSGSQLIFESQYVRLRTQLPENPHLYGLGEHTDPFQLPTSNYARTFWSREAMGTPERTNLYGNHPMYFEHRGDSGTHGVFLRNSNGMQVKIDNHEGSGQYLEYNTLGGVLDLYFLAGPSPTEVSRQYAEVVGLPAMMPYWGFGFHQCKYGYRDVFEVAEVVANYSLANIPLETMWTDINYMDLRKTFTLDPERYPLHLMRELVDTLHARQQNYIVMVDPAVAHQDYPTFNRGVEADVFLKNSNGSINKGVTWPGASAFPDWFSPNAQDYWSNEFAIFFSENSGVDIDGLWIDMNEPSNFCPWPCDDPEGFARETGNPPENPPVRSSTGRYIPGFPAAFQPNNTAVAEKRSLISPQQASMLGFSAAAKTSLVSRPMGSMLGLPDRDLLYPNYQINNTFGVLSNCTLQTDLTHANGLTTYDTHNMYGSMMSSASRVAMLNRRPGRRPLVITRSTFSGAGKDVGSWLGDNLATWFHYRISIAQILEYGAMSQVPMVGADICGFGTYDTTEKLCARWTTLGAWYPFFRNHGDYNVAFHELYLWPSVAQAAREAIDRRLRLLDYLYTAFYQQTLDGTPLVNPLFFLYPQDETTFPISLQFFYGDALLISPVTQDNGTSVTFYLPNDTFYDYFTWEKVQSNGSWNTIDEVSFTAIPIHIRGGTIIPMRAESANTTTELRKKNFELLVAPGTDGKAKGQLYLDDGDSIEQEATSSIKFTYEKGRLNMDGTFGYDTGSVGIVKISVLGVEANSTAGGTEDAQGTYNATAASWNFDVSIPLTKPWSSQLVCI